MRIGIDMDGCLVDFAGSALPRIKSLWGLDITYEELVLPRIETHINSKLKEPVNPEALCRALFQPGFFISMLPMPGAIVALQDLCAHGHEIFILTKAFLQSPHIAAEKAEWLAMHLKNIPHRTFVMREMDSKHYINVDVIVDDDPIALEHPTAVSIAVEHPWNGMYLRSPNRKSPIHRIQSMDFLPWILDIAVSSSVETDQRKLQAYKE